MEMDQRDIRFPFPPWINGYVVAKRCISITRRTRVKLVILSSSQTIVVKITSLKVSLVRSGIGSLFCCYHDQANFVKCCKNAIRTRGGKFLQLS